jgi:hypothetical protein
VLEIEPAVDEHKLQRCQPAEVVPHRIGRDEKDLVCLAKVIGEPPPIGTAWNVNLLRRGSGSGSGHPLQGVDRVNLGIVVRPPRQVRRHVPQRRTDLQHPPGPGMHQQREHRPRINLARIAAERAVEVGSAEPGIKLRLAHRQDSRWGGCK